MTTLQTLYRIPSHPYRWVGLLALSQAAVALLWWHLGWVWGVPALLLSHAAFVVPVFLPRARLYAPVLARLPGRAPQVWLTIDDGPSDDTPAMLELLDAFDAKATFFVVGARASSGLNWCARSCVAGTASATTAIPIRRPGSGRWDRIAWRRKSARRSACWPPSPGRRHGCTARWWA